MRSKRLVVRAASLFLLCFITSPLLAAPRTWVGNSNDWIDGGNMAFWSPADEPDADDEAIFNTGNGVNLGSNNSVNGLTMSGGIDLFTNNFDLTVDGLVQLTGASTNLFIGGVASELNADNVTINSGGTVELSGGTLILDEESGTSLLDINAGGTLSGNGVITFADTPLLATTLLTNDGTLTALSRATIILNPPPVGTLQINDSSIGGRVDLDGVGEAGIVNVNRNQTLDLNVPLSDAFNGTMNLYQNSTFDSVSAWTLAGGALNVDNGAVAGIPGVPAGKSTIAGGTFTQSGGVLNIVDDDGVLQFDSVFNMTGGTLTNRGLLIFNNDATISAGATVSRTFATASLTVAEGRIVTITTPTFDMDGSNTNANVITVNSGATLAINTNQYDPDGFLGSSFEGTVNLNGGDIVVTTGFPEFVMNGVLNMNRTGASIPSWSGEPLDIGNDSGVQDAKLNVTGTGISQFGSQVDFNSDADVNIAAGAILQFITGSTVNFDTVNGGNNAKFAGTGQIQFNGAVNVNEAVTLNMFGGTVDLDGNDDTGEIINIDAALTVNAATMASFGRVNGGGGINTLDVNNSVGAGVLTVNLDDPNGKWTLNAAGVLNLVNDNTESTLLAGSDVNINGIVNIVGDVRTTARVDIGSTGIVNINTSSQPLRLAGGTLSSNPNTINGGTINGAGLLGADTSRSLRGFGTINTGIDFDGTASLLADNGTLTINGAITDVGTIGTFDVDGTLHVTNAWNNNVSTGMQLNGGVLSGGAITNDVVAGISGHGFVTARVVNNTQLFASIADSLIFQTAGNDNDWDGTTNTGKIHAVLANIELRDNATFGFTGTVEASNSHTAFTNGFALDFNPGSTLALSSGGTYESTNSTDLGGAVTVGAGAPSTIKVAVNNFLTFESTSVTTLGQNLRLENNNIRINAGATFAGAGAVIIPDNSHLIPDNSANINALLVNEGTIRIAGFDAVGAATVKDYQQMNTGELFVELTGTLLNQYDRLTVTGQAQLDGYLNIDIDGPFVPALGNTFNILTAAAGVFGQFSLVDISGMPAGLTFHLNYLPNAVQLQVVSTPFFSADFDHDGDVDATDYAIWKNAYGLNQLGDANGDGKSDAADYTLWRNQLGSHPGAGSGSGLGLDQAAVPEPGGILLLLAGTMGWLAAGRTRRPV